MVFGFGYIKELQLQFLGAKSAESAESAESAVEACDPVVSICLCHY